MAQLWPEMSADTSPDARPAALCFTCHCAECRTGEHATAGGQQVNVQKKSGKRWAKGEKQSKLARAPIRLASKR